MGEDVNICTGVSNHHFHLYACNIIFCADIDLTGEVNTSEQSFTMGVLNVVKCLHGFLFGFYEILFTLEDCGKLQISASSAEPSPQKIKERAKVKAA